MLPEAERAAATGALYEATDGGEFAEVLIDLSSSVGGWNGLS